MSADLNVESSPLKFEAAILDRNRKALTKTSSRSPSRIQKCPIQDFKSAISLESMGGF